MKKETTREPLLVAASPTTSKSMGGLWTLPFIVANGAFEKVASYGVMQNMILYLMNEYKMQMSTGTNFLFFWSAAFNFTPFLYAFLADSFFDRFHMIAFGSITCLLGMLLLWSTSLFSGARPSCDSLSPLSCSPTISQLTVLCSSFTIMSIGGGGMRSSSLAFGADQIMDTKINAQGTDIPSSTTGGLAGASSLLESYLNWYYVSVTSSILVSLTCIVYIQDHFGWKVGFGVPVALIFISALSFFSASPFYVKMGAKATLFSGFSRVIGSWWKNRRVDCSSNGSDGRQVCFHCAKGSSLSIPSNKLRFLNKACVITSTDMDSQKQVPAADPQHVCTLDQVEEFKVFIKVIPLWSTGIMLRITANQHSFRLLQANSMDRHVFGSSGFVIPAGSFGTFPLITITLWIAFYDRLILPLASKLTGKPTRLGLKTRMGIGLFLSYVAMSVSALVKGYRRESVIQHQEPAPSWAPGTTPPGTMSALWVVPQYCLFGLAEAFVIVAQNEFFYSEFPRSMASIASTMFGLGMSVASLFSSLIVSTVDSVTSRSGNISWVSSNINEGHYDYYYWLLAALSLFNCLYFLLCCRACGPCEGRQKKAPNDVV